MKLKSCLKFYFSFKKSTSIEDHIYGTESWLEIFKDSDKDLIKNAYKIEITQNFEKGKIMTSLNRIKTAFIRKPTK